MTAPQTQAGPGRPLAGAAALSHAARAEAASDAQALARGLAAIAARSTALPAPDALRMLVGRDDALRILALAGHDHAPIVREWREFEQHRERQEAARRDRTAALYAGDPDHDERVMALLRSGAPMEEISRVRAAVAAEYALAAPPTTAQRYDRMRAEHDRATFASQRSQSLGRGEPPPPASRPPALATSAMPGTAPDEQQDSNATPGSPAW